MNTTSQLPTTLIEAVKYFSDINVCNEYMISIKWPDGKIVCPACGGERIGRINRSNGVKMLRCNTKPCRKQFSAKIGTIFEDSPLGLDKWFVGVWCITNAKNGISSHELGRAIGVTQKTAWFMLHRIRLAMRAKSFQMIKGHVETDETFIGGKARNIHKARRKALIKGRGTVGKVVVHGMIERGGKVRARVVKNQKTATLQAEVRAHVEPGSTVYSDALASYTGLSDKYVHEVIDHAVEYVRGNVHTNSMENFWCILKRALMGTYTHVAPEHLDRYLDEQINRFNNRKIGDQKRFVESMAGVIGRRLTWAELTAKEEDDDFNLDLS